MWVVDSCVCAIASRIPAVRRMQPVAVCTPAHNTLSPTILYPLKNILFPLKIWATTRYLSYIDHLPKKGEPLYAVLRDANDVVLSVSPVINAEATRITNATTNLLIEVSGGESLEVVQQVTTDFLERFAAAYKAAHKDQGLLLQVAPVRLLTPLTGHVRSIWPRLIA